MESSRCNDSRHERLEGEDGATVVYSLVDGRELRGSSTQQADRHPISIPASRETAVTDCVITTSEQWFEYYATRYPSRAFLEGEVRRAEQIENDRREQLREAQRKRGHSFLFRLFLGSKKIDDASKKDSVESQQGKETDDADDGDCNSEHDEASSFAGLDHRAITNEARSFHRFHLVSERRALCSKNDDSTWNAVLPVRRSVGSLESRGSQSVHYCIVGYGKIAEFPSLPENEDELSNLQPSKVTLTGDWHHLEGLIQFREPQAPPYDLRHCRAAAIGHNCIIVSWGRGDGWVVIYRRMERPIRQNGSKLEIGWEVIATASPSRPVIKAAMDAASPDPYQPNPEEHAPNADLEHRRLFDSGALFVTDLVPAVSNDNVILSIGRLGGFVELVPIPKWMWMDHDQLAPNDIPDNRRRDYFVDLTQAQDITAFSTKEFHVDVIALDAICTRVSNSGQNSLATGSNHPAEVVLVACGESGEADGETALTYWGITTMASDPSGGSGAKSEVIVRLVGRRSIENVGADVTLFASPATVDHWANQSVPSHRKKRRRMTSSITTMAPVVALRLTSYDDVVLLAALDFNGGVTVIDCTAAVALAEQSSNEIDAQSETICSREVIMTCRERSIMCVSQVEWWPVEGGTPRLATTSNNRPSVKKRATSEICLHQISLGTASCLTEIFCVPTRNVATILLNATRQTMPIVQISAKSGETSIQGIQMNSDPSHIIATLLDRGEPSRALDVAACFGGAESFGGEVVDECRTQLWESERDAQALVLVSNDKYMIDQAIQLIHNPENSTARNLDLNSLRDIFREAASRCDRLSKGKSVPDEDYFSSSARKLGETITKLGTFQLLMKHLANAGLAPEQQARRFLFDFQHESTSTLASEAAFSGDVIALTILISRHPLSTLKLMKVLEELPFEIELSTYASLLPCPENKFLPRHQHGPSLLDQTQLFEYLCKVQHQSNHLGLVTHICTDDFDKEHVVTSLMNWECDETVTYGELAAWYRKLVCAHVHAGNKQVQDLCEAGLIRLGAVDNGKFTLPTRECNEDVHRLLYIYSASRLLSQLQSDKVASAPVTGTMDAISGSSDLALFEFCSMKLSDVIQAITNDGGALNLAALRGHLSQFSDHGRLLNAGWSTPMPSEPANTVEDDLIGVCLSRLRQCRHRDSVHPAALLQALSICCEVVTLGRTTGGETDRVVKSDAVLLDFVEEVFKVLLEVVDGDWSLLLREVLQKIWAMYETLPSSAANGSKDTYQERTGSLYFKLVLIQLVIKWRGQQQLPASLWKFFCADAPIEQRTKERCQIANAVVSMMCSEFCVTIARQDVYLQGATRPSEQQLDSLFNFISDMDELDKRFLRGSIRHSGLVGRRLFANLLDQHSFVMLRDMVALSPTWFCDAHMQTTLLSFVENAEPSVAIKCIDILGPRFCNLASKFDRFRRSHDAKQFVTEVMNGDTQFISELPTTDITCPASWLQSFLSMSPKCMLIDGCDFWDDPTSAFNACADAAMYFSSQIAASLSRKQLEGSTQGTLPPMPGQLVMQLANILGLDDLFTKRCMVDAALSTGLPAAAVAITYSMLCDAALSQGQGRELSTEQRSQVAACVAIISGNASFDNIHMKKELCAFALQLFSPDNSTMRSILAFSCKLERGILKADSDQFNPNTGNVFYGQSLLSALNEIRRSSSDEDLLHRVNELSSASPGSIRTNLSAVCEAVLTWIVTASFDLTPGAVSASHYARTLTWMEICSSCFTQLLASDAPKAKSLLRKFEENFGRSRAANQSANQRPTEPDEATVQRLSERGYSRNASRRAVIMTNNKGYSAALTWAVSHFTDPDFDAPIVLTGGRDESDQVDEQLVELALKFLELLRGRVSAAAARPTEIPPGESERASESPETKRPSRLPSPRSAARSPSPAAKRTISPRHVAPPPFRSPVPRPPSPAATRSSSPRVSRLPSPSARLRAAATENPGSAGGLASPSRRFPGSGGGAEDSSMDDSIGNRVEVRRQVQRGGARTGKLSAEERRKLAVEGRRLLELARQKNRKVKAPPTSITTR